MPSNCILMLEYDYNSADMYSLRAIPRRITIPTIHLVDFQVVYLEEYYLLCIVSINGV